MQLPPEEPVLTNRLATVLQVPHARLEVPGETEGPWSGWYVEAADTFEDFQSFSPPLPPAGANAPTLPGGVQASGTSFRSKSVRQMSGQFEDEVAKSWEEDWEDEDLEDTYDAVAGKIGQYASQAASFGQTG